MFVQENFQYDLLAATPHINSSTSHRIWGYLNAALEQHYCLSREKKRNKLGGDECETTTTEPPQTLPSIKLHTHTHTKKKKRKKNHNPTKSKKTTYFRFEIVPGSLILLGLEPLGVLLFTST